MGICVGIRASSHEPQPSDGPPATAAADGAQAGGNLRFDPAPGRLKQATEWIDRLHAVEDMEVFRGTLKAVLESEGIGNPRDPRDGEELSSTPLSDKPFVVFLTDFEPDDTMAIAQIWQLQRQRGGPRGDPVFCMPVNFDVNDGGKILEIKLLIATLLLGVVDFHLLPPATASPRPAAEEASPKAEALIRERSATLDAVCRKILACKGEAIDLHIMAPMGGNLAALVTGLGDLGQWRWRVSIYSGSFNMRGMTDGDVEALRELARRAERPLLDVSSFPFFGGKEKHHSTASFTTFAAKSFGPELAARAPLLAAAITIFSDTFNSRLIWPGKKLFKCKDLSEKLDAAGVERFSALEQGYVAGDTESVRRYAEGIYEDQALFEKVASFKKSTVAALAHGVWEGPLCDQLLFACEWLRDKHPSWLAETTGEWRLARDTGFTTVEPSAEVSPGGTRAVRPVLADPLNEDVLHTISGALQEYVLRHLDEIYDRTNQG